MQQYLHRACNQEEQTAASCISISLSTDKKSKTEKERLYWLMTRCYIDRYIEKSVRSGRCRNLFVPQRSILLIKLSDFQVRFCAEKLTYISIKVYR